MKIQGDQTNLCKLVQKTEGKSDMKKFKERNKPHAEEIRNYLHMHMKTMKKKEMDKKKSKQSNSRIFSSFTSRQCVEIESRLC